MENKKTEIVTPEFQNMVQELINNLQPEQFPDATEYKLALEYNALPLGFDLLAYVLLTPKGEVIWEDYEGNTGNENDLQGLIRVLVAGKRRYPELARFIPNSSADSHSCPICKGSGRLGHSKDLTTDQPRKCIFCAGLGWVTDEAYSEILKNIK